MAEPIRIEAEDLTLKGYRLEGNSHASDNSVISFLRGKTNEVGTASTIFDAAAGTYDISVAYYDENDGTANLQFKLNGIAIDTWDLDKNLGSNVISPSNFVERTVATNLTIAPGDVLEIVGTESSKEHARVDYIEFAAVSSSAAEEPQPGSAPPSDEPIALPAQPQPVASPPASPAAPAAPPSPVAAPAAPQGSVDASTIYGRAPAEFGDAVEINLPDDPDIAIDIQDFGAKGDGVTDDSEAIQSAIYAATASNRALYFPNGTYRVTREIRFDKESGKALRVGPHLYGQSRNGVVIKLDDNAPGFGNPNNPDRAVFRAVHKEDGTDGRSISADQFNRYMENFTIDVGNNPGAVGIKFYSNNTGTLRNIRIVGNGKVGLDVGTVGLNGPHLIQNIEVDGLDIGVRSDGPYSLSSTMSNIAVKNADAYGVYNAHQVLQVEGLAVEDAPVAVFSDPTSKFGVTTLTLVNGTFSGGDPSQPAIENGDVLFARNINTSGYSNALQSIAGTAGDVQAASFAEYSSHGVSTEFGSNADRSLNLPIRYAPLVYDPNPSNWLSVKDFGAIAGDKKDDTAALQAAIDAAAASGKTTVYFPGDAGGDPNWYTLEGSVDIHGSVRHLIGFAPARIVGGGKFVVAEDPGASEVVQIQNFNFTKIGYENASSRTLSLYNLTGSVEATGPGDVFLNSVVGSLEIDHPEAEVWARQLNTEGSEVNIRNNGGRLWLLGHKTEGGGIKAQTLNGGETEILGAHIYSLGAGNFDTIYEVSDANASFAGIREHTGAAKYSNFVRESRQGDTRIFGEADAPTGPKFKRGISLYSGSDMSFASESPTSLGQSSPSSSLTSTDPLQAEAGLDPILAAPIIPLEPSASLL